MVYQIEHVLVYQQCVVHRNCKNILKIKVLNIVKRCIKYS
jgi:hypothetical protein